MKKDVKETIMIDEEKIKEHVDALYALTMLTSQNDKPTLWHTWYTVEDIYGTIITMAPSRKSAIAQINKQLRETYGNIVGYKFGKGKELEQWDGITIPISHED